MPRGRRTDTALLERRRQAIELRNAGATYAVIAEQLGYSSAGAARKTVLQAYKLAIREPAEEVLDRELERLDTMLMALWGKARRGEVQAIDRVLKIMDRRAKYLGLDRVQVEVTTHDGDLADLDAALAALTTSGTPASP